MGCRTVNILDLCHIVKRFALTDNVARKLIWCPPFVSDSYGDTCYIVKPFPLAPRNRRNLNLLYACFRVFGFLAQLACVEKASVHCVLWGEVKCTLSGKVWWIGERKGGKGRFAEGFADPQVLRSPIWETLFKRVLQLYASLFKAFIFSLQTACLFTCKLCTVLFCSPLFSRSYQ